jgi:hypothetical protein
MVSMARGTVIFLTLSMPSLAGASELDDLKGWRATRTVSVDASTEYVLPHLQDFEQWPAWAPWGAGPLACEGAAGAVGRACTWTGADGGSVKMVITAVDPGSLHYDYFFGDNAAANKAILAWTSVGEGTTVTWDTAGTPKSVPKELKKTAADVIGKDFDAGLAKLKTVAEADFKKAVAVAEAEKKAAELEGAAKRAEDAAAAATKTWEDAKAAADAATAAIAAAKPKEKPALQTAADAATKAAEAAKGAADAAAAAAGEAKKLADAARAEAKKLAETPP